MTPAPYITEEAGTTQIAQDNTKFGELGVTGGSIWGGGRKFNRWTKPKMTIPL